MNERMNEGTHCNERHTLKKHGLTTMKGNKNYWNYSQFIEFNHSISIKHYEQINSQDNPHCTCLNSETDDDDGKTLTPILTITWQS